jgi:beta-galactosidase
VAVACPAGSTKTVTIEDAWPDPKLWWPQPNPHLYTLRTTVSENRKPLDVHDQTFGFREVTIKGPGIYINGVRRNFWNWVDVHQRTINKPEEWADTWRQEKNRFMRFSHGRRITRVLKSREERLDFYDRAGVAGRLCTMIDGMFISYNLGERTREKDAQGRPLLVPNEPVWANFRQHMAQVARAYRNHPSVIFHQVENELVYINGMNIYGGYLDTVEELMSAVCEAGRKEDPSRPYTVGGGGDLSGKLEINSPHYPHTALDYYPENAYTLEHYATKIRRWPWDRKKPWVVGESLFANEMQLGAYVAGDEVFRGKEHALRGKAKFLRMIYGGYRWAGVAGFFPWDNLWQFDDSRKMFSDLYACPRKQTSRLFAGQENSLLFKIMNDTLSREPVTFEWAYRIGDRRIAGETIKMTIEPGFGKEHTLVIPAPDANARQDGTLTLRVSQAGAETYEDERLVPVLPTGKKLDVSVPVTVLDRSGALADYLAKRGVKFARADSLAATKGKTGLLLIGHDTLTPEEAFGTGLLAFAASGGRVVCLEQEHPPAGSALPAPLRPTQRFAGFVHPQALGTPVFADLGRDDLIDWAGDHPTAKNLYHKPSQGARSLAQCGGDLEFSPLVEVPCGEGVIVVCQLRVGAKLGVDPSAETLLRNLVRVYGCYRPSSGTVAVFSPGDPLLADNAAATGALASQVASLADALDPAKCRVALVHATRENLQALLAAKARADAFQKQGGWLMLCGLGPKGIDPFNRLAGTSHLLRPFRYERVTLPRTDHPLASTLGSRDVALYSPKPLMHGRYWVSSNTFSHVVDGIDFAPFTLPPGASDDPYEYKPTFDDHDPYNFVNGILNDDSWRCIQQIWIDEQGPKPLVFRLRKPDTLDTVRIWNNANYWTIEDIDVILDGDPKSAIRLTLPDGYGVATAKLPKPAPVQKTITLQIRTWRERPLARPDLRLVGIDNVQFLRPAPPEKAVALDSVGGLVVYPNGKGGMLLNQLKFLEDEPRESNAAQKVRLLGVLLQNMGVGSRSAAVVAVPGVNVRFHTINLQEFGNAYLDDRSGKAGWFGSKGQNLATLPRGQQVLADVTYHVVDYRTAPTPDVLMLGGSRAHRAARGLAGEIKGIPVGRKADTLYFLHTANVDRPVNDRERAQMNDRRRPFVLPTVLKYVLHYDDGKTAEVPVVLEKHIDHWVQQNGVPLPGAQIGWSKPLEALQGKRATLYSMQAPNPRPGVAVKSIDAVRVGERATPVVLAISTGTVVGKKGN